MPDADIAHAITRIGSTVAMLLIFLALGPTVGRFDASSDITHKPSREERTAICGGGRDGEGAGRCRAVIHQSHVVRPRGHVTAAGVHVTAQLRLRGGWVSGKRMREMRAEEEREQWARGSPPCAVRYCHTLAATRLL
eukprot:716879-Rhodomonas_salina.2